MAFRIRNAAMHVPADVTDDKYVPHVAAKVPEVLVWNTMNTD